MQIMNILKIASVLAKIRTEHLMNVSRESYRYTRPLDSYCNLVVVFYRLWASFAIGFLIYNNYMLLMKTRSFMFRRLFSTSMEQDPSEKLTVGQLPKKFYTFYRIPIVHYPDGSSRALTAEAAASIVGSRNLATPSEDGNQAKTIKNYNKLRQRVLQ
jgi:hypothetical protein